MNIGVVGAAMSNIISKAALGGNHREAHLRLKANKKQHLRKKKLMVTHLRG